MTRLAQPGGLHKAPGLQPHRRGLQREPGPRLFLQRLSHRSPRAVRVAKTQAHLKQSQFVLWSQPRAPQSKTAILGDVGSFSQELGTPEIEVSPLMIPPPPFLGLPRAPVASGRSGPHLPRHPALLPALSLTPRPVHAQPRARPSSFLPGISAATCYQDPQHSGPAPSSHPPAQHSSHVGWSTMPISLAATLSPPSWWRSREPPAPACSLPWASSPITRSGS